MLCLHTCLPGMASCWPAAPRSGCISQTQLVRFPNPLATDIHGSWGTWLKPNPLAETWPAHYSLVKVPNPPDQPIIHLPKLRWTPYQLCLLCTQAQCPDTCFKYDDNCFIICVAFSNILYLVCNQPCIGPLAIESVWSARISDKKLWTFLSCLPSIYFCNSINFRFSRTVPFNVLKCLSSQIQVDAIL